MTAFLTACGGGGGKHDVAPATTGQKSVTVMLYMIANNNLEADALDNLAQAVTVGSSGKYNMLVQCDRSRRYSSDGAVNLPSWEGAKRLRVQQGSLEDLETLGAVNMAEASSLSSFVTWAAKTSPADRYVLLLWDHGSGWSGYGDDNTAKTVAASKLTLPALSQGLKDGMSAGGIRRFDLIGFDACLMASLETARALSDVADYLVASEELEPGHGWDYASFGAIKENTDATSLSLAKSIVAGFDGKALARKTHANITLSVTDLGAVAPLLSALTDFTAKLSGDETVTLPPAWSHSASL